MANYKKLRQIFNIADNVSDKQIADALEQSGVSGKQNYNTIFGQRGVDESPLDDTGVGKVVKKISDAVEDIKDRFETMDKAFMDFLEGWRKADKASSNYARTIGTSQAGLNYNRDRAIVGVANKNIGFDFNMDMEELLKAQTDYSKAVGRNVRLSHDSQRNLAAMTSAFQDIGGVTELLDAFDKMGVSLDNAAVHSGKIFHEASKSGISLERYAKNIEQGLAMANTYTFRNGIRGMEAMAKRAAAVRMDMAQVSSFADKFSSVEDAISNSAKLQVLGGSFAQLADPLNMLNMSLNDLEGIEDTIEKFVDGKGSFNKQTGEVDVSTFNRLRLKQFAEVTGQDFNKVMEVTRRKAMRGEIESQIAASKNMSGIDEDFKELIKNTATFKDGKAGVTIDGKFKSLDEINEKDRNALIAQTKTDSENIQDIAKSVRNLDEIREGFSKTYEAIKANIARPLGNITKGLTSFISGSWIAKAGMYLGGGVAAAGLAWQTARGVTSFANIGRRAASSSGNGILNNLMRGGSRGGTGGGNLFSKAGNLFKRPATSAGNAMSRATNAVKSSGSLAKVGATFAKTAKTAKQVRTALKAGKLAKAVATGAKSMGAGVPIVGGLISAGLEAYENKEQFKDRATRGSAIGKTAGAGIGAAIGTALGAAIPIPVLGPIIGGVIGEKLGKFVGGTIGKIQDKRVKNNRAILDTQLQKYGIQRKGDYSVSVMKDIDKALQTGKMTDKLRRKLLAQGDQDILDRINKVKADKREEKKNKIKKIASAFGIGKKKEGEEVKKKIGTANFEVGTAYFGGTKFDLNGGGSRGSKLNNIAGIGAKTALGGLTGGLMLGPVGAILGGVFGGVKGLIKGKKETGDNKDLMSAFDRLKKKDAETKAPVEKEQKPIEVNINGTLKLEYNGKDFDILSEMKNNPKFKSFITNMVSEELNRRKHGSYSDNKSGAVTVG